MQRCRKQSSYFGDLLSLSVGDFKKKKVIAITAVRDCDGVIFGRRSSPKWESSSFGQGMALAETTSAHDGILRTQLRTYGIASIVPESDDA